MGRRILVLELLFLLGSFQVSALPVDVTVDWQLSLRIGTERPVGERVDFRYDAGISCLGLVVFDVLVVKPIWQPAEGPRLDLIAGVPNAGFPVNLTGAMVSVGGGCRLGWQVSRERWLSLRLGAGYPFFFEPGKPVVRDVHFPLGLWPDLALEFRHDKAMPDR